MGQARIPPIPPRIIMTDRADGSQWLLSYNTTLYPYLDGLGAVSINNVFTVCPNNTIYGAYEGPVLAGAPFEIVLFIRNGTLGFDYEPSGVANQDRNQARIMATLGLANSYRELVIPTPFNPYTGVLAWEDQEF